MDLMNDYARGTLKQQGKANVFPYGIDYPDGKATGRFGNDYLGIDYFVKTVYRGVNFGSEGVGILYSITLEYLGGRLE